jgi:hypothetical protein
MFSACAAIDLFRKNRLTNRFDGIKCIRKLLKRQSVAGRLQLLEDDGLTNRPNH